jgi:hypothetical protein
MPCNTRESAPATAAMGKKALQLAYALAKARATGKKAKPEPKGISKAKGRGNTTARIEDTDIARAAVIAELPLGADSTL